MYGYAITAYGTAKNPIAPPPYSSAGTAITVYAVYRSPPIRNQVTQVPKLRPARPHSSSDPIPAFGRRHRAAQNPATVTSAKKKQNTTSAVVCRCNRTPAGKNPVQAS